MERQTYQPDYNNESVPFIVKDLCPDIYQENGTWFAIYSTEHQDSITGIGNSPEAAMQDFERDWNEKKQNSAG